MISHPEVFDRRGYTVLRGVLPAGQLTMLQAYATHYAKEGHAISDRLVPGTPAGYGHPCMERVLLQLVPTIEAGTGRKVFPTYSYFRVYRRGDVLPPHKDRPSCEISFSLCLGYTGASDWPLRLQTVDGPEAASLAPGDGVLYKGIEMTHWREPFEGESAVQVFLHYVDQNGPCTEWRFDKREGLRLRG